MSAHKSRFVSLVLLGLAAGLLLSFALGACGKKDPWAGTWVTTSDGKAGFVIEKKGAAYAVHDPDGSNAFEATLGSDGALHGSTPLPTGKKGQVVDVVITKKGENLVVTMSMAGTPAYTAELKRQ